MTSGSEKSNSVGGGAVSEIASSSGSICLTAFVLVNAHSSSRCGATPSSM